MRKGNIQLVVFDTAGTTAKVDLIVADAFIDSSSELSPILNPAVLAK